MDVRLKLREDTFDGKPVYCVDFAITFSDDEMEAIRRENIGKRAFYITRYYHPAYRRPRKDFEYHGYRNLDYSDFMAMRFPDLLEAHRTESTTTFYVETPYEAHSLAGLIQRNLDNIKQHLDISIAALKAMR
jgi:hypothetical protein